MPSHPPGRPPAANGAARAIAIRHAALELFTQRGYAATTMADIGQAVGIRGPSLYKHVSSKQQLLVEIMVGTMEALIAEHGVAVRGTADPQERLRRATEAHVRYHVRHRHEAFVGTREIRSLEEPNRSKVLSMRDAYEQAFRDLVQAGVDCGRFHVTSVRLASYAILDLGMGVSVWYREAGELSENQVAWQYGEFALRLVGAPAAD
ncbi:TetR/AcrR family transcriptional regulator [Streptomyces sp. NPDC057376]|uniref:TetR/AcrR family transcriptional regulator n=1 Tax=unclassified Streptomyces TaxID=2593676 RepID=UPI0009396B10|nr:TetR/AcrR family transcriptional regulator [Streptomyces sp. CB02414]OKI86218.1 transcriptional regulator [Streptomyces sp. CB02414]